MDAEQPVALRAPLEESPAPAVDRPRMPWLRRSVRPGLEVLTSVVAALILPLWAQTINVDPLDRIGQVSGLAGIQLRFAIVAGVLVAALLVAHRLLPGSRDLVTRLGCAAVAGLASGLVAAGIVVALRGTPWSLWVGDGDYRTVLQWTRMIADGQDVPDHYPPMIMYIVGGWGWLSGLPLAYALKGVQIVGTALFGPAAYLCWRLLLRPGWALGIGVVAMLPFIEPVKPYPQITLVMLIPVVIAFLRQVRRAEELSWRRAVAVGLCFGVGLGLLFLLYSGWFVWIAPGMALAAAILAPWRAAVRRVLVLAGSALAAFVVVGWVHLRGLFSATGGVMDNFFYFDTYTEPTYIAMWANDRPAGVGAVWPPPGELGGLGLFTILLVVGLGVAIWLGWRRTAVVALVCSAAGAWVIRMWLASEMYETRLVRLYPRTTMIILYCLLVLTGLAVMYACQAARARATFPVAAPVGLMLVPLLLVFASAGSATASRYLPDERTTHTGYFSWIAHKQQLYDGTCPHYGRLHGLCANP